jgi:hypothetical protein
MRDGMGLELRGAGLGRTGTLSLKLALERLGFGPCYHGKPDWTTIFDGYLATVDYPGCTFWRELIEFYPSAKVLLTGRDPEEWFDSTQQTIFCDEYNKPFTQSSLREFFEKTVFATFDYRIHDRDFLTGAFLRHYDEVQQLMPQIVSLCSKPPVGGRRHWTCRQLERC